MTLRPLGAPDLDIAASIHARSFAVLGERGWTRQEIADLLASPGVAAARADVAVPAPMATRLPAVVSRTRRRVSAAAG